MLCCARVYSKSLTDTISQILGLVLLFPTLRKQGQKGHLNVQVVAFLHLNLGLLREVENL